MKEIGLAKIGEEKLRAFRKDKNNKIELSDT